MRAFCGAHSPTCTVARYVTPYLNGYQSTAVYLRLTETAKILQSYSYQARFLVSTDVRTQAPRIHLHTPCRLRGSYAWMDGLLCLFMVTKASRKGIGCCQSSSRTRVPLCLQQMWQLAGLVGLSLIAPMSSLLACALSRTNSFIKFTAESLLLQKYPHRLLFGKHVLLEKCPVHCMQSILFVQIVQQC